jgi:integrase/recombinase XerD
MSELREALEEYIALRRSLGTKLQGADSGLRKFIAFAESEGALHITADLALRWARQSNGKEPGTWAGRLQMVRGFATWRSATDPQTEIPSKGLLPFRYRRKPPYIYSDEEIERLITAARELPSSKGMRGATYSTLFGLLAVTGMRLGEALALDRDDVDLREGILTIRLTKFHKSRLAPIHQSTSRVLSDYEERRDRVFPRPISPAFFVSDLGSRPTHWSAEYNFAKVSQQIGLREPMEGHRHGHGPRLHDMRHRFAARTLVDWYRAGIDVEREMPRLATYLGHVHVNETYWYLEAVPELLQLATERLVNAGNEMDP